jgi:hypothetical protein
MNKKINFYFGDIVKNELGASDASIDSLVKQIGFKLPPDYISSLLAQI